MFKDFNVAANIIIYTNYKEDEALLFENIGIYTMNSIYIYMSQIRYKIEKPAKNAIPSHESAFRNLPGTASFGI